MKVVPIALIIIVKKVALEVSLVLEEVVYIEEKQINIVAVKDANILKTGENQHNEKSIDFFNNRSYYLYRSIKYYLERY